MLLLAVLNTKKGYAWIIKSAITYIWIYISLYKDAIFSFFFLSIFYLKHIAAKQPCKYDAKLQNKSKHTIFTFETQIVVRVGQIIIIFRLGIHMFIYAYILHTSTLWYYSVNRHVSCEVCPMNYSIRHK